MASVNVARTANSTLASTLPNGLTAVFIGATSGIGLQTLKRFTQVTKDKSPHIYVIGRSAMAVTSLLAELRKSNSSAKIHFIERDVSLVKNVDPAMEEVKKSESKVDLLFLSVGFMSFAGRQETAEGLEPSMTTRYYSRVRAIQQLLPLLNSAPYPRVVNILASGLEGPMIEDDLDLAKPGNFGLMKSAVHIATMMSLTLNHYAIENPKISFIHAYPGVTSTPLLTRGSKGAFGFILRKFLAPVVNLLFASSVEDVGERSLFYSTNPRYGVIEAPAGAQQPPKGLPKPGQTSGGVFLIDGKGKTTGNVKQVNELIDSSSDKVWAHTVKIWDGAVKSSK